MSDDEIERLATKLADKMQNALVTSIYQDAGKNLIGLLRKAFWAALIAIAAWGAARYGAEGHGG